MCVPQGALPIWRSHIGVDTDNPQTREAWEFLRPSVEQAELCIFTRPQYVPSWLELPVIIVPPSIDPFSAKNQELSDDVASAVLVEIGLVRTDHDADPVFMRRDGSPGRASIASPTSSGRARPRTPTCPWSYKCRAGTASRTWRA